MSNRFLNDVWENQPHYIRRFYENIDLNRKLCSEVEYILNTEMSKENIEIAHTSSRAKTLESFCEKISRKNYQNPFEEITDFAGVRVVFLYSESRVGIENIVETKFDVIEKIDKVNSNEDKFGYGALHYLVKMKDKHAGARYDDLKNKVCEIQVRTILQDAWAIVAHHLSYKQESDVPKELQRKLNALSGMFEIVDDQFESLKKARNAYRLNREESMKEGFFGEVTINVDDLSAYLTYKFPQRQFDKSSSLSTLLKELKLNNYNSIADINRMLDISLDAVYAAEEAHPPFDEESEEDCLYTPIGLVRSALSFHVAEDKLTDLSKRRVKEFKHLLKLEPLTPTPT